MRSPTCAAAVATGAELWRRQYAQFVSLLVPAVVATAVVVAVVVAATATAAVVTAMEGGEMVVVVLGEVKMVVGRAGKGRTAVVEKASEAVVIVVAS